MIDTAKIKIKAGNGGDGFVHFRREKFIPHGGPDGGDGGNGGNFYFVADINLSTLIDFRAKTIMKAESGIAGMGKKMTGASAPDIYVKVPVGTLIYEKKPDGSEILIGDLSSPGQTMLVAKGGIGGKGNFRFRSSTNQAPLQYTQGEPGEEKDIRLEIKLVADVGLVGAPNAGKSTLINHLTNANAKVASYPFTTLDPNLGTLTLKNKQNIVIADIPGLIEGASSGKGLGDDFLRHVERTRILIHIVNPLEPLESGIVFDINKAAEISFNNYSIIRKELEGYGKNLTNKPEIVVLNKIDITEIKDVFPEISDMFRKSGITIFPISAATGEGVEAVLNELMSVLDKTPKTPIFSVEKPVKAFNIDNLPNKKIVFRENKVIIADRKI